MRLNGVAATKPNTPLPSGTPLNRLCSHTGLVRKKNPKKIFDRGIQSAGSKKKRIRVEIRVGRGHDPAALCAPTPAATWR